MPLHKVLSSSSGLQYPIAAASPPLQCRHRSVAGAQSACGYYLPLDNGGYPFEWVSNYQVLTAVHLNPLKTKNRTFTLPAGDKKTATEAMEKRREGRQ